MYIEFQQEFNLPIDKVFSYFKDPIEWMNLFGFDRVCKAKHLRNGWKTIPLKKFPFPLVAKMIVREENKRVRYIFVAFWRIKE